MTRREACPNRSIDLISMGRSPSARSRVGTVYTCRTGACAGWLDQCCCGLVPLCVLRELVQLCPVSLVRFWRGPWFLKISPGRGVHRSSSKKWVQDTVLIPCFLSFLHTSTSLPISACGHTRHTLRTQMGHVCMLRSLGPAFCSMTPEHLFHKTLILLSQAVEIAWSHSVGNSGLHDRTKISAFESDASKYSGTKHSCNSSRRPVS
ncbi:hypothetical protein DFH11DRAFT_1603958 [Phellopilus nigrolimitatus]|nr:hypothetical protein DFH11DRAFT_1603958 [Phellopilus nigrolimitatus]